jgi:HEAT repeat protein
MEPLAPSIRDMLASYGQARDPRQQREVLETLDGLGDPVIGELVSALADTDALVRQSAASVMGGMVTRRYLRRLGETGLADDGQVYQEVIAPFAGEDILGGLIDLLADERRDAIEPLGYLKSEAAVDALVRAMDEDPLPRVIVLALANLAGPRAVPTLIRALGSGDESITSYARWGLVRLGDAAVAQLAVTLLDAAGSDLQEPAAEVLAEIGTPDALATLSEALAHSDESVQAAAERALGM